MGIPVFPLSLMTEQREIEALERLRAFLGELGSDTLLLFESGDLMGRPLRIAARDQDSAARIGAVNPANHATHLRVSRRRNRTGVEHRQVAPLRAWSFLKAGGQQLTFERNAVRLAGSTTEIQQMEGGHDPIRL